MTQKIVTLYIDDISIRMLVTHGKRIKKWAELPLEPGLIKNGVVIKGAEVATKLKQFLKAQKVSARKVIIGVSGLHCLTRPLTLPPLPHQMLEEAVKREAKRVLPVPLEQLYISWQTIPSPDENTRAFVVAMPHKPVDVMLKMLNQAGLKPDLMDLKPLALASMVKEPTAVVVDVQPTEFDIVIMSDGVAQPIRTVPLPDEAKTWKGKLQKISSELDRTIQFFNANNPENPLDASASIFASGELADKPKLCKSLSDELGFPVLPLPSPLLKCPEGLDPNRYMVNIGLTLTKLSPRNEPRALVTNLNALPASYRPKPISLTRVFALPGAAIAFGLLIPVVILIQGASADVALIRNQLDTTSQLLQNRLSQRQVLQDEIAELEKKITEEEATRGNFTIMLSNIEKQSNKVNSDLEETMSSLPGSISLTSLSHAGSILTIKGGAPGEQEVLSYLRNLKASGRFPEITIASMVRVEGEEAEGEGGEGEEVQSERMNFTLILKTGEQD